MLELDSYDDSAYWLSEVTIRKVLVSATLMALAIGSALAAGPAPAEVRYVDCVNGDDGNDGLSWVTAVRSIAAAFDSLPGYAWNPDESPCIAGFEVNVASGVCDMPAWIDTPRIEGVVRGMGRDQTRLTSSWTFPSELRIDVRGLSPVRRYSFEDMSMYRVDVHANGGEITIANVDFGVALVMWGDLRVERHQRVRHRIRRFEKGRRYA